MTLDDLTKESSDLHSLILATLTIQRLASETAEPSTMHAFVTRSLEEANRRACKLFSHLNRFNSAILASETYWDIRAGVAPDVGTAKR